MEGIGPHRTREGIIVPDLLPKLPTGGQLSHPTLVHLGLEDQNSTHIAVGRRLSTITDLRMSTEK